MDRRRYLRLRRWWPLLLLLRLLLVALVVYGANLGLRYIMHRSHLEVEALRNRPQPDVYLGADSVKMNVIDDQGRLAMEISGKSVTLSQDQRTATFKDAEAKYYENGRTQLEIVAGQIEYDTQSEDFHITRGEAADALKITTNDGWTVSSEEVEWRRFKASSVGAGGQKPPSFRFPQGVRVQSREGNVITASYMQADRDLQYMEFVGNFSGQIRSLRDTQFLTERQLTNIENLKLQDFEDLHVSAEQVIYDKRNQVVLATSRFYERPFVIRDFDGQVVRPEDYQPQPQQVLFSKPEATIAANHIEAHIARKWAESFGDITMVLPPDRTVKQGEDRALHEMKQYETRIAAGDIEYFWSRDYVLTKSRTIIQQEDRRAEADRITYWGDKRMVLLEGGISLIQGSGDWLTQANLIDVRDHDQARITKGYTEMSGDRAVVYLDNNDIVAEGAVMVRQDNREVAADQLVYQDQIKLLTAKGNVKFWDVDGQSFIAQALQYDNEREYVKLDGGTAATIRLPAKYANDINRSIAESREQPVPPEVADPPVPEEPVRNPNTDRIASASIPALPPAGGGLGIPGIDAPPPAIGAQGEFMGPRLPGDEGAIREAPAGARELILNFGGERDRVSDAQNLSRMLPEVGPIPPEVAKQPVPANTPRTKAAEPAPAEAQPGAPVPQPAKSNVAEGNANSTKYQRDKERQERR